MAALAIPLIASAIPALAGLFGGAPKKTTTDTTQNSSTVANLTPEQQQLIATIGQGYNNNLNYATDINGYQAQGEQNINQSADAASKISSNVLAARGLSYSPYAGFIGTQNAQNRTNQLAQFNNTIPLVQQQLRNQSLQGLQDLFSSQPKNSSSSGTTNTVQTGPPNQTGGFFSGLGAGLFSPSGPSGQTNISAIANAFGGGSK